MWPFLGSLVSGGASLLGSMFSSNTSADNTQANIAMQQQTNQMAMAEAQKNRDFTQQMSSSAYQRASQDMQSAGLNPAMMFGSGGPASTPGGTQPQLGTAKSENTSPFAGLGDAAGKAVSTAISMKQFERMTEEIANLKVENEKMQAVTSNVKQSTETEKQETVRRGNLASQTGLAMPSHRVASQEAEAIENLPRWARDLLAQGQYGGKKLDDVLAPILNSARSVRQFMPDKSEVTRSGSRWNSRGEENHYEDSTFSKRFTGF